MYLGCCSKYFFTTLRLISPTYKLHNIPLMCNNPTVTHSTTGEPVIIYTLQATHSIISEPVIILHPTGHTQYYRRASDYCTPYRPHIVLQESL